MIKKIKINTGKTKYAFLKASKFFLIIIGIISSLMGIFFSVHDIIENIWLRIICSFSSYLFLLLALFLIFYFWKKISIKRNKFKISIIKDNILDEKNLLKNEILIFAVDSDYTINFDGTSKISSSSVQGQFIKKYGSTIKFINNEDIRKISYIVEGKTKYALLVPLTEIKEENHFKAQLIEEVKQNPVILFKKIINVIDGSNYKNICLPIIGSGQTTPFTDYLSDRTNLICLWISLFKVFYREKKELNLNFFVSDTDWYDLRFSEI